MDTYKNVKGYICDAEVHSPRAEFIREYNSWFMTQDLDRIMANLSEDIVWEMVGDVIVEGIGPVREFLSQVPPNEGETAMVETRVDGILVDGAYGSSFGTVIMGSGDRYAYNDVLHFREGPGNIIDRVKTFMLKLND